MVAYDKVYPTYDKERHISSVVSYDIQWYLMIRYILRMSVTYLSNDFMIRYILRKSVTYLSNGLMIRYILRKSVTYLSSGTLW